jgi:hypothetical protein
MKPFYVLDDELVKAEELELERDVENESDDTIIVNTSTPTSTLKRNRGQPYKALNVIIFLQDDP